MVQTGDPTGIGALLKSLYRLYSSGEFPGLKTTVFGHFWAVLDAYKRHTPLHIGLLSPQICTDLRGVNNPWKIRRKSAYRRKRIHPVV